MLQNLSSAAVMIGALRVKMAFRWRADGGTLLDKTGNAQPHKQGLA